MAEFSNNQVGDDDHGYGQYFLPHPGTVLESEAAAGHAPWVCRKLF
jgi:hypothetical protein